MRMGRVTWSLLLFTAAGCRHFLGDVTRAYEGEPQPRDEIARIPSYGRPGQSLSGEWDQVQGRIVAIDGRAWKTGRPAKASPGWAVPARWEVPAGPHTLSIEWRRIRCAPWGLEVKQEGCAEFEFDLIAGVTHMVEAHDTADGPPRFSVRKATAIERGGLLVRLPND